MKPVRSLAILTLLLSALLAGCDSGSVVGAENLEKGKAFLAQNGTRAGVTTTASGLQYEVLQAGNGATPKMIDEVVLKFVGIHIDGSEFDRSNDTAEEKERTYSMKGVLPGWREALLQMGVGARWKLYLPQHLAYTNRGIPDRVAPLETVIYEVELVKIQ